MSDDALEKFINSRSQKFFSPTGEKRMMVDAEDLRDWIGKNRPPVQPTVTQVFHALLHGPQSHQDWLREALDCVFAGKPVPEPDASVAPAQPKMPEGVAMQDYKRAAETIESIYAASQHCDCASFGIAQQWRNETNGGTLISGLSPAQPKVPDGFKIEKTDGGITIDVPDGGSVTVQRSRAGNSCAHEVLYDLARAMLEPQPPARTGCEHGTPYQYPCEQCAHPSIGAGDPKC